MLHKRECDFIISRCSFLSPLLCPSSSHLSLSLSLPTHALTAPAFFASSFARGPSAWTVQLVYVVWFNEVAFGGGHLPPNLCAQAIDAVALDAHGSMHLSRLSTHGTAAGLLRCRAGCTQRVVLGVLRAPRAFHAAKGRWSSSLKLQPAALLAAAAAAAIISSVERGIVFGTFMNGGTWWYISGRIDARVTGWSQKWLYRRALVT